MARQLDAATLAKVTDTSYTIVNLLEFYVIPGDVTYLTDCAYTINHNAKTYQSTQGMLSVTDITEEDQLNIERVDIVISAVKSDNVKIFLDYDYIDRRVIVYRAILDDKFRVVGEPFLVFDGRLDQPMVVEDFQNRTATLRVTASSHWLDFDSTNGRHTNDTEQKVLFPGDKFFEFASQTQRDLKWGKA
jgi:hypothetical protein